MSRESMEWLNTFTLIGNAGIRGNAWHWRRELQGLESNHYDGPIPVEDVLRRLFNWEAVEAEMLYRFNDSLLIADGRKLIVRGDTGAVLGAFKSGYEIHQPAEWLLENVATILDDELGITSAGLLRNGAIQWVEVGLPESVTTPEGVEFLPNLLATGSCDGSIATTYKKTRTDTVCDNTRDMALSEDTPQFKVKHTKYSGYKIHSAREALAIVHQMEAEFSAEVARLCAWKVSDDEFTKHMQVMIPVNDELSKVAMTKAENKRGEIVSLYNFDERVAPWKGTAFGVGAAYNTWRLHKATVRKGVPRQVRNMENLVTGKQANEDAHVLKVLADVTGHVQEIPV